MGRPVVVTARDAGITVELLRGRGITHTPVGGTPPTARAQKVLAVASRAAGLTAFVRAHRPAAVLCSSRAAAIVARVARIPCFVICDYEHAELGIYRRTNATVMHPAVIPAAFFAALGFSADRLIQFDGIKEDITFAGIEIDAVAAHDFGPAAEAGLRILVRPPAEISHYFTPRSKEFVLALYRELAGRNDVLTVFSPRYPRQVDDLAQFDWHLAPLVLREAIPFLPLLKAVDRVVSAGGTMIREAAYLGVPAYSLFGSELGAVDEYLERTGLLTVLRSEHELSRVTEPMASPRPLRRRPEVLQELADEILARAQK
jgi:predicted glycosyltransferase